MITKIDKLVCEIETLTKLKLRKEGLIREQIEELIEKRRKELFNLLQK